MLSAYLLSSQFSAMNSLSFWSIVVKETTICVVRTKMAQRVMGGLDFDGVICWPFKEEDKNLKCNDRQSTSNKKSKQVVSKRNPIAKNCNVKSLTLLFRLNTDFLNWLIILWINTNSPTSGNFLLIMATRSANTDVNMQLEGTPRHTQQFCCCCDDQCPLFAFAWTSSRVWENNREGNTSVISMLVIHDHWTYIGRWGHRWCWSNCTNMLVMTLANGHNLEYKCSWLQSLMTPPDDRRGRLHRKHGVKIEEKISSSAGASDFELDNHK